MIWVSLSVVPIYYLSARTSIPFVQRHTVSEAEDFSLFTCGSLPYLVQEFQDTTVQSDIVGFRKIVQYQGHVAL